MKLNKCEFWAFPHWAHSLETVPPELFLLETPWCSFQPRAALCQNAWSNLSIKAADFPSHRAMQWCQCISGKDFRDNLYFQRENGARRVFLLTDHLRQTGFHQREEKQQSAQEWYDRASSCLPEPRGKTPVSSSGMPGGWWRTGCPISQRDHSQVSDKRTFLSSGTMQRVKKELNLEWNRSNDFYREHRTTNELSGNLGIINIKSPTV